MALLRPPRLCDLKIFQCLFGSPHGLALNHDNSDNRAVRDTLEAVLGFLLRWITLLLAEVFLELVKAELADQTALSYSRIPR